MPLHLTCRTMQYSPIIAVSDVSYRDKDQGNSLREVTHLRIIYLLIAPLQEPRRDIRNSALPSKPRLDKDVLDTSEATLGGDDDTEDLVMESARYRDFIR